MTGKNSNDRINTISDGKFDLRFKTGLVLYDENVRCKRFTLKFCMRKTLRSKLKLIEMNKCKNWATCWPWGTIRNTSGRDHGGKAVRDSATEVVT